MDTSGGFLLKGAKTRIPKQFFSFKGALKRIPAGGFEMLGLREGGRAMFCKVAARGPAINVMHLNPKPYGRKTRGEQDTT